MNVKWNPKIYAEFSSFFLPVNFVFASANHDLRTGSIVLICLLR